MTPNSEIFQKAFLTSSTSIQHQYIKQLFAKQADLAFAFINFIHPHEFKISEIIDQALEVGEAARDKISKYHWEELFQEYPSIELYDELIWNRLEFKVLSDLFASIQTAIRLGNAPEFIKFLLALEYTLNMDWEQVEPPAAYEQESIISIVDYRIPDFISEFFFTTALSKEALQSCFHSYAHLLQEFKSIKGFDHRWSGLKDHSMHQLREYF